MIKTLHVVASMNPEMGGVCHVVRTMISNCSGQDDGNAVICLDAPDAAFLQKDKFTIYAMGPARGPWGYSGRMVPWLVQNLDRFNLIIVHGLWQFHTYAVNRALTLSNKKHTNGDTEKRRNPKLYVMPHGMLDPYFQHAPDRKLKAIRNLIFWKFLEHKLINNADAILFTCDEERRLACEPFRTYHPKKEMVIGFGIDPPPSYKVQMRTAFFDSCPGIANTRYLLFLGRIHEKKGVELLINAYTSLLKFSNQTILFNLVIAGPGVESSYGSMVRQSVLNSDLLRGRVLFPGMLSGDAKWGAYYGCEAFILPSHQENFGIAVVEALASGKPVLISNKINIWREIKESGAGIIGDDTKEGTEESLKSWIGLEEEARMAIGNKALVCFKKCFTKDRLAEKLSAL